MLQCRRTTSVHPPLLQAKAPRILVVNMDGLHAIHPDFQPSVLQPPVLQQSALQQTVLPPAHEIPHTPLIQPRFQGEIATANLQPTEDQHYQTFSNPQNRRFTSFESLLLYINDWSQARGYSMRIATRGKRGKDGDYNSYYLCCSRANNRSSYVATGQRKRVSNATDCPYKMTIARETDHNPPYYYIRKYGEPAQHNHDPLPVTTEHANIQRLYAQGREARQKLNQAVHAAKAALDRLIEDEGEEDDWALSSVATGAESRARKNDACESALANLEVARRALIQHYDEVQHSEKPKKKKQRVTDVNANLQVT